MIRAFVMDVDGTMTDGKIYMSASGEAMKAFNIKDGYGIHEMLPAHGVVTVIMTGRESKIVENRAKELSIDIVMQGIKDKKEALLGLAQNKGWSLAEIAFIGDDVMDLPAMEICGISGCPKDAALKVKKYVNHITESVGGAGAIREFIEWLIRKGYIE